MSLKYYFILGIAFSTDNWVHISVNRQRIFNHSEQQVKYLDHYQILKHSYN